jgi:hypothetical protein
MKISESEMAVFALLILGLLFLYSSKQKSKYPIYRDRYLPVTTTYDIHRPVPYDIYRPPRYPRYPRHPRHPRHPRPHNLKPGKDWHIGPDGKYLPESKGGVVPIKPFN